MAELNHYIFTTGLIITIIMGLSWGSLATMAIYRLPKNMPWIGDKPRCLMCKTPLSIIDYFSILSFFYCRGKCRHCNGQYEENIAYFITELAITLLLVLAYIQVGFGDLFVLFNGLVVAGVIIGIIDAQHNRIPAKPLICLLLIGAVYRTFIDGTYYGALYSAISWGIVALFIRGLFLTATKQKELALDFTRWQHEDRFTGIGFDYVKLAACMGVWLGFEQMAALIASVLAIAGIWYIIHSSTVRLGAIAITLFLPMVLLQH